MYVPEELIRATIAEREADITLSLAERRARRAAGESGEEALPRLVHVPRLIPRWRARRV